MIRNTAWLAVGSVLAVGTLASGAFNIVDLLAHEMETRISTFPAAGIEVLDVDGDAGSVTIQAADVDQITVRARIGHGLRRSGSSVAVDGNRLVVRSSCPAIGSQWCDVRYTIEVPADIDVVVSGDNDGITVTGINGHAQLHTDNGSIRATDLTGDVVMSADNGSIHAIGLRSATVEADSDNGSIEIQMAAVPKSLHARTDNGDVVVVMPPGDEVYAVQLDTDNGHTENALATDQTSDLQVVVTTNNGDATVRYPD